MLIIPWGDRADPADMSPLTGEQQVFARDIPPPDLPTFQRKKFRDGVSAEGELQAAGEVKAIATYISHLGLPSGELLLTSIPRYDAVPFGMPGIASYYLSIFIGC